MLPEIRKPHIITDEAEARTEYARLIDFGFEVRRPGRALDITGFVEALERGEEIQVRRGLTAGDKLDYDAAEIAVTLGPLDPLGTYQMLVEADYSPRVPGTLLTEDEFVEIAAARGVVDLVRTARNPYTGEPFFDEVKRPIVRRYYGTTIGKSGTPAPNFTKRLQGRVM